MNSRNFVWNIGGATLLCLTLCGAFRLSAGETELTAIGVTALRQADPSLNGAGVTVAQAEPGAPEWEVNPTVPGRSQSFFTYYSVAGTATTFPNALGSESHHGSEVADFFYGINQGVAPGVIHCHNYEASYFYTNIIKNKISIPAKVVNQSLYFDDYSKQQEADRFYDNYAARYNILFVTGAGTSGSIYPPATCYNGLGVAAYGNNSFSSTGPTLDNGRSKPDLAVPVFATSYAAPYLAGCAAILVHAGTRGDGGGTAAAATDIRTLKALLINGAVKPSGWTNGNTTPLDARYGAGVLNVFNSYNLLANGKQTPVETTSVAVGAAHPPGSNPNNISSLAGWDFAGISNTTSEDKINHYYFYLSGASQLTASLVWNRQENQTAINDLNLFLYDGAGNLVRSSISSVDNVEHLFVQGLPPGHYDLQVLKKAGAGKWITAGETYALAFNFSAGTVSPTRFRLSTTSVGSGSIQLSPTQPDNGYLSGTVVTLTASTENFFGWGGALSGTSNPINLTMNGNKTVSALFRDSSLIWQHSNGTLGAWVMDGTTLLGSTYLNSGKPLPTGWNMVAAHDFNSDGSKDFLLQHINGQLGVWFMNGNSLSSSLVIGNSGSTWRVVGLNDFDGDSKADILFQHLDGRLAVWYMDGTTYKSAVILRGGQSTGPDWKVVGVKDFNADSKGDILFQHTNGQIAVWYMNGIILSSSAVLQNPGASWRIVGLGDFNSDGKADFLFQNSDEIVAVWFMNGVARIGSTYLLNGRPLLGWKIGAVK